MIELRKAGKDEALGDVQSANTANSGKAFSKLQKIFTLLVTGQEIKISDKRCYAYTIIHLDAMNNETKVILFTHRRSE
jgi:hypothetical protein